MVTFVLPIGVMLFRSVDMLEVAEAFPETLAILKEWDGVGTPSEEVYASLAAEMSNPENRFKLGKAGTRLNYTESGPLDEQDSSQDKARGRRPLQRRIYRYRQALERNRYQHHPFRRRAIPLPSMSLNVQLTWTCCRAEKLLRSRKSSDLRNLVRANSPCLGRRDDCLGICLPHLPSAAHPAVRYEQLVDDPGAASILDIASGADNVLNVGVQTNGVINDLLVALGAWMRGRFK